MKKEKGRVKDQVILKIIKQKLKEERRKGDMYAKGQIQKKRRYVY